MLKTIIVIIIVISISIMYVNSDSNQAYQMCKETISYSVKDPKSAEYENRLELNYDSGKIESIVVSVRAMNLMGGFEEKLMRCKFHDADELKLMHLEPYY